MVAMVRRRSITDPASSVRLLTVCSWCETGGVIRLAVRCSIAVAVVLPIGTSATASSHGVTAKHITLVAVGDSLPYGRADCGFCQTFVDLFRTAVSRHGHVLVTERNLSEHTGIDTTNLVSMLEDATIVIVNKIALRAETLGTLPKLQFIAVSATGTDGSPLIRLSRLSVDSPWRVRTKRRTASERTSALL